MGPLLEITGLLAELFWLWVLYECNSNEEDRDWRWIVAVGNVPAAVAYLVLRRLPNQSFLLPNVLKRWTLRRKIAEARAAARHIGNAHQFRELGKLLQGVDALDEALEAFRSAVSKDPADAQALWGVATIEAQRRNLAAARAAFESLLRTAPDYRGGEAALAYVRVLLKSDDLAAAERMLETYLKDWNEPEARYYMARLRLERRETAGAVDLLEGIVKEVNESAPVEQDRNLRWMVAAHDLLSGLKRR